MVDATQWERQPGQGTYARPERERRFLLRADPPASPALVRRIEDRYVEGTRLRLRHVSVGGRDVFKLTQKVRVRPDDPSDLSITNTYLAEQEHAVLCALPSRGISKTRSVHRVGEHHLVVDTFHGRLSGLRLAEVELVHLTQEIALPDWLGEEVTHDDRFAGGGLAFASDTDVHGLLTRR